MNLTKKYRFVLHDMGCVLSADHGRAVTCQKKKKLKR